MLRDYQSALVAELSRALIEQRSVCLQLPTGGGKTHIAAHYIHAERRRGKRVWVVCHRREIVRQTCASLEQLGVAHGVVAAGSELWSGWQVQVCSIGTLRRMLDELPAPDLIVWDEAHHIVAKSWSALRERMSGARHLGLTATPVRLDGKGLDGYFNALICGPQTADLIAAGHLANYRLFAPTIPDLRGVGVRAGDYAKDDLAKQMVGSALVGDVVEHYQRIAPGSRAVAFAVSVEASRAIVARFNSANIPAAHIDGATAYAERDAAIADLEAGRISVLSNVEVFTEGFDLPAIDAVILLRPTRSFALYRQMIGRGLRTAPGKAPVIILDHAGLVYEHGMPDEVAEWTLQGVAQRDFSAKGTRLRRCPECSAVHSQASECPECGHTYTAADRSIDEVYGELRPLARTPRVRSGEQARPGHDTYEQFAIRVGATRVAIIQMFGKGLPRTDDGLIPVDDALAWARDYRSGPNTPPLFSRPSEYENTIKFGKRIGRSREACAKLKRRGLPCASNGWVHVEKGLAWFHEDQKSIRARHAARGMDEKGQFQASGREAAA